MKNNQENQTVKRSNESDIQYGDVSSCYAFGSNGCERCNDGYVLHDGNCYKSIINECIKSLYVSLEEVKEEERKYYTIINKELNLVEKCFKCNTGYTLDNNNCTTNEELKSKCKTMMPSGGCAICKDKYYRVGSACHDCDKSCATCNQQDSCNICESNYFIDDVSRQKDQLCHPYSELTNCTKTIPRRMYGMYRRILS
jgi:hypothetical protein